MRKRFFIIIVVIWILILSGCSKEEEVDYTLIKDNITASQISRVEIEKDVFVRDIVDTRDIDDLISLITSIKYLKGNIESISDSEGIIRIKLYNQKDTLTKSLSILEEASYYNKKWYPTDKDIYDRIDYLYNNIEAQDIEDKNLIDINQRRRIRKSKSILEALQGTWISEDDSLLRFEDSYLKQGKDSDFIFKYIIEDTGDDYIDIRAYGSQDILLEGKELFRLNIMLDDENAHMLVRKTMTGGITYYDKYIFIEDDGLRLGEFDSPFFFNNRFQ